MFYTEGIILLNKYLIIINVTAYNKFIDRLALDECFKIVDSVKHATN